MRRKRHPYKNPFDSEADLAAHFIAAAREHGWRAYPETDGFDILLVATLQVVGHFEEGDQIGVQAKLVPNIAVLFQALPRPAKAPTGPKYYAVLIPHRTPEFAELAKRLGIKVFEATNRTGGRYDPVEWHQGPVKALMDPPSLWVAHQHKAPCWFPDVEVDIPAGVANPRQLTPWKFKAVRLALHGVLKGYLTTKDFKDFEVSMSRWVINKWIRAGEFVLDHGKRRRAYHLVPERVPPHLKFPEITEAVQREDV